MHHVGAAVLAAKATRAQTEAYLVPIARGAHIATLALSEPGTGGDFYLPESRLECPLYPSELRARDLKELGYSEASIWESSASLLP